MRLPNTAHTSRPWRIHELTRDFRLEDVWALPTPGGSDDFPRLVQAIASGDPSHSSSRASRALFAIRWKVGELLGWDRPDTSLGSGCRRSAIGCRRICETPHPARSSTRSLSPRSICSRRVGGGDRQPDRARGHAHRLGPGSGGGYRGQMAVYAKPNGRFGAAYMAAIRPFRHLIVYPAMLRQIERQWRKNASSDQLSPPS